MTHPSEFSRNIPTDAQSVQSVQTTQTVQSEAVSQQVGTLNQNQEQQSQLASSSQVERQRIQRSSSSASSKSSISGVGATSGRAEGPVGTGSYQQSSVEGAAGFDAQNASFGSSASGERRQGRFRRQVIRLPDQPSGQVRQVRRRLPTPEPDTLERVYIQRTGAEVVEEITEIPTTPPPRVQERTVVEPAGPPQVVKRTIRVPPRGGAYGGYQQQQQQQQQGFGYQTGALTGGASFSSGVQGSNAYQGTLPSAGGSFSSVQQTAAAAAAAYQQQAGGSFVGGYSGAAAPPTANTFVTNYGASGLPQAKGPVTGTVSFIVDPGTTQVLPPTGCQHAFCFYV